VFQVIETPFVISLLAFTCLIFAIGDKIGGKENLHAPFVIESLNNKNC